MELLGLDKELQGLKESKVPQVQLVLKVIKAFKVLVDLQVELVLKVFKVLMVL